MNRWDVLIVGGGLAGLTSATILARAGKRVALLERSNHAGGHAVTQNQNGYLLNLGPHALYMKGEAVSVLRELGIEPQGTKPTAKGSFLFLQNRLEPLPSNPATVLMTKFGPLSARWEVARFLISLMQKPASLWADRTVAAWLRGLRHQEARDMIKTLIRVSSYSNAPDIQSAEMAADQLQRAVKGGVLYVHGGWQTIVDALRSAAENAGVRVITSARVDHVRFTDRVHGVALADGSAHDAEAVVLAVGPKEAAAMVPQNSVLRRAAAESIPVRAATLDVGLSKLPDPTRTFALGMHQPYYYSVHSHWARLAPADGVVLHVAKYLEPGGAATADELEAFLDVLQPGWRSHVETQRFLPELTVNSALVTAAQGGFAGRPSVTSLAIDGLYLAGDWIGNTGFLADASLSSARTAANALLQRLPVKNPKVA